MSDMQTIKDDLAYMRALATEGRRAPLLGGSILLAAGLLFGTASLCAWAIQARLLPVGPAWLGGVWTVSFLAFMGCLVVLTRGRAGKPGASALNNRATAVAWSALGWSIFTFLLATASASWALHSSVPEVLIAPFVLTVYGVGWTVAAAMSDRGWVRWVGIASFVGAVIMGALAGSVHQFLVYAGALFLLVAAPGYALMRQEPSLTV